MEKKNNDRDNLGRFAIGNNLQAVWTKETAIEFLQKVYNTVLQDTKCRSLAKACSMAGGYETLIYYLQDKFDLRGSDFEPIKACKEIIKQRLMEQALDGEANATMAIFILKNNHDMSDKVETKSEVKVKEFNIKDTVSFVK